MKKTETNINTSCSLRRRLRAEEGIINKQADREGEREREIYIYIERERWRYKNQLERRLLLIQNKQRS